ncbi:MAG TPA: polyprenyl synthetase family protein [Actinocrinis sp.]|nr:polyprenyl synthetase family protein [Actinocrinis sp.]
MRSGSAEARYSDQRVHSRPDHAVLIGGLLADRWGGESGLLGEMCRHTLAIPGKLFRSVLLVESAVAVGGDMNLVLPAALGTEIGHVASLVHDDIIDEDEVRRGQPALHAKFGAGDALVAGDALLFDLFRCLAECRASGVPDSRIVTALEVVSQAGIDLCRGQSLESELTVTSSLDLELYTTMVRLKTGALFSGACRVGGVLSGGSADEVSALGCYGDELGIAFQMCDDLLAYTSAGDDVIGKSMLSDIRNRRMTLPVILALKHTGPEDLEPLFEHARSPEAEPSAVLADIRQVMTRSGAIERSREIAVAHASAATDALAVLRPTASRGRLAQYASRAINRLR